MTTPDSPAMTLTAPVPRLAVPQNRLGFALFILVNAALFVRPGEILPDLADIEVYQWFIIACFVTAFPAVLEQFQPKSLEGRPTTLCVLALLPLILLSNLLHGRIEAGFEGAFEFFKVVIYYLLFVGLVDSPARLRTYLFSLGLFATLTVGLAILDFHEVIHLPDLKKVVEGEEQNVVRMQGTGLFHDPNEIAVLISVVVPVCLYWLTDKASGLLRVLWAIPLAVFAYGLILTQSRGGLLAVLVGLLVFLRVRFGTMPALVAGLLLVPGLAYFAAGRMTDVSAMAEGTGRSRMELWSDGLEMFRGSPLIGVGCNQYQELAGHVAHNSYLHAFSELGVFGGLFFLGAFWYGLSRLWAMRRPVRTIDDPTLQRMHPFVMGSVAAFCVGMMSLTLNYIIPAYTVLGLATVFLGMAHCRPPMPPGRVDGRFVGQVVVIGVVFLVLMYVGVRVLVR